MTANEVIALLMAPVGGLLIAGFLLWWTGRPEKPHHPAE